MDIKIENIFIINLSRISRMKISGIIAVTALMLLSVSCLSSRQILQQYFDGAFVQNGLPKSTTIIPCLDDASANKLVSDIGKSYNKSAKGNLTDVINVYNNTWDYYGKLPQDVQDCLDQNQEIQSFFNSYNIDVANRQAIDKLYISYIFLHYLNVHKQFGILNDMWIAQKYYQCGFEAATFAHLIFKLQPELIQNIRDLADLVEVFLDMGQKLNLKQQITHLRTELHLGS